MHTRMASAVQDVMVAVTAEKNKRKHKKMHKPSINVIAQSLLLGGLWSVK